jgi:hypothetical protein
MFFRGWGDGEEDRQPTDCGRGATEPRSPKLRRSEDSPGLRRRRRRRPLTSRQLRRQNICNLQARPVRLRGICLRVQVCALQCGHASPVRGTESSRIDSAAVRRLSARGGKACGYFSYATTVFRAEPACGATSAAGRLLASKACVPGYFGYAAPVRRQDRRVDLPRLQAPVRGQALHARSLRLRGTCPWNRCRACLRGCFGRAARVLGARPRMRGTCPRDRAYLRCFFGCAASDWRQGLRGYLGCSAPMLGDRPVCLAASAARRQSGGSTYVRGCFGSVAAA